MLTFAFVFLDVGGICVGVEEECCSLPEEKPDHLTVEVAAGEQALEASNAAEPATPVFRNSRRERRLFRWGRLAMISSFGLGRGGKNRH
jgi:hypothetical protein